MQLKTDAITEELAQLNIKRDELRKFIMNPKKFNELTEAEQQLLISQQQVMSQYADILSRRIAAFK